MFKKTITQTLGAALLTVALVLWGNGIALAVTVDSAILTADYEIVGTIDLQATGNMNFGRLAAPIFQTSTGDTTTAFKINLNGTNHTAVTTGGGTPGHFVGILSQNRNVGDFSVAALGGQNMTFTIGARTTAIACATGVELNAFEFEETTTGTATPNGVDDGTLAFATVTALQTFDFAATLTLDDTAVAGVATTCPIPISVEFTNIPIS